MNKQDLVKYVSDKIMITEKDSGIIYDVMFEGIREALVEGDTVKVRELGTFYIHDRKPRKAIHPKTHKPIGIPAKKVIKFKPSKKLIERLQ
jgi:DNA-binding protein HU-beta